MSYQHSLEDTIGYICNIYRAHDLAEVRDEVLKYIARFGATHVLAGTIPNPGTLHRDQLAHVILDAWPSEWAGRYFSKGYLARDPTIKLVREYHPPFLWTEIQAVRPMGRSDQRVMHEAADFGLKQGLTLSIPTLDTAVIGFSIAGEHLDISPNDYASINFLATIAIAKLLYIRDCAENQKIRDLNGRDVEALQLRSEGKTVTEISKNMRISVHGVDFIMRRVRQRLGVTKLDHAVGEGFRLGLLR